MLEALDELVYPETRGNPMSKLRWTSKSSTKLADELVRQGFEVSSRSVLRLLHKLGYSLQANAKVSEGRQHPDRDAQFNHLNDTANAFIDNGQPVISVDSKKKELIGNYTNGGAEWAPAGEPERTNVHDFADPELAEYAKAIPYGVYDVFNNEGWVNVGDTADTAAFAVESIRRWWYQIGQVRFPDATRLLITADAGGSNGYRVRAWKVELAALAKETGLDITVCHYPPGTSKWNKIEHRLFSFITINWRGRPLTTMRTIIELISATSTSTGLSVLAEYDPNWYPKGVKITDRQLAALPLVPNDFHGVRPSASSGPHASTRPYRSISSASPPADGKTSTGLPYSPHRTTVMGCCSRSENHRSRTFRSSATRPSLVVELLWTRENPGQPGPQPVAPVLPAVPVARLDVTDRHPGALEHRDHGPVRRDQWLVDAAADEQPVGDPPRGGPVPVHEPHHRLEHRSAAVVVANIGEDERPGLQQ